MSMNIWRDEDVVADFGTIVVIRHEDHFHFIHNRGGDCICDCGYGGGLYVDPTPYTSKEDALSAHGFKANR